MDERVMSDNNRLAPSIANRLYAAVVPLNARVLLDTVRGETAPITEKDLSTEELDVLRQMYAQRAATNESRRQELANQLSVTPQEYAKNPKMKLVNDAGEQFGSSAKLNGTLRSAPVPYDEYIRDVANNLASFDRTKHKTSLSYNDYPDQLAAPTFDSWLGAVWKSYTDPAYRIKTLLGSFNVKDEGARQYVEDKYNFDKRDFYQSTYGIKDLTSAPVAEIWKKSNGPVDFLDMMMIKKFPTASRKVEINLK